MGPISVTRQILFTILLGLTITKLIHCDLQQINDKPIEKTPDEQHSNPDPDSPADNEYIKRELKELIQRILDQDKNGLVSYEELKKYLADLHEKNIDYNVDKQWTLYSPQIHEVFSWEGYEPEKKEVLTWDHYFNQTYPELMGVDVGIPINREQDTARVLNPPDPEKEAKENEAKKQESKNSDEDPQMKTLKLMVQRADARWRLADENGDTLLTKPEFKMLLHPDEGYEELQNLFIREATEDMDLNHDGKICLDEFMNHLQVLASDQEKNDHHWLSSQQENFGRFLDKNKDGILDGDEIRNWLVPPKSQKFESEAKRLLDIGDVNEDHSLSSAEILEHFEQYISLLPPEYWQNASQDAESNEISHDSSASTGEGSEHDEL